jgi:hypothetical protein
MLVKTVLSQLAGVAKVGHTAKDQAESAARKAIGLPAAAAKSASGSANQLPDILAQYDVTNISPQAFSDMLQRLHQSGALPDKDFQDLSAIRKDLDQDGVASNQRVNLVDIYGKKLKSLEQDSKDLQEKIGTSGVQELQTTLRRRVDWLQKLSAIHAAPNAASINALA